MNCTQCGKSLTYNETGLCKRLLGKTTRKFYCKHCLAALLGVSVQRLEEKQRQYLEAGCCLFVPE